MFGFQSSFCGCVFIQGVCVGGSGWLLKGSLQERGSGGVRWGEGVCVGSPVMCLWRTGVCQKCQQQQSCNGWMMETVPPFGSSWRGEREEMREGRGEGRGRGEKEKGRDKGEVRKAEEKEEYKERGEG